MSDKMDGVASENPDESEAAAEVRTAWLGLIRLLAREVIRHLDQGKLTPGEDPTPNAQGLTGPHPREKGRPSDRS